MGLFDTLRQRSASRQSDTRALNITREDLAVGEAFGFACASEDTVEDGGAAARSAGPERRETGAEWGAAAPAPALVLVASRR